MTDSQKGTIMSQDSSEPDEASRATKSQEKWDDELAAELDRRLAAHEANPDDVRTSEEVWGRILGKQRVGPTPS